VPKVLRFYFDKERHLKKNLTSVFILIFKIV